MSPITADQKFESLLWLYGHTHDEITRYRDLEWKIVGWSVALLGGIITLVKVKLFPAAGQPDLQTLLSGMILLVAGYGIWHIHFVHEKLKKNRQLRQHIENQLELTGQLIEWGFIDEKPITYLDGIGHVISWWSLIILVAIYAIFALWFQQ